jgi:hypothetical protein
MPPVLSAPVRVLFRATLATQDVPETRLAPCSKREIKEVDAIREEVGRNLDFCFS